MSLDRNRKLFKVSLYTNAQINQVCSLHTMDVYRVGANVRSHYLPTHHDQENQETRSGSVSLELDNCWQGIGAIVLTDFRDAGGEDTSTQSLSVSLPQSGL